MDQSIPALVAFTFSAAMTPGPNNVMLMTSAVNFGFRRSIPHMLGVALGLPAMVLVLGSGFGAAIGGNPLFHDVVSAIGIPYLAWLAWKIASADVGHGLVRADDPVSAPRNATAASADGRPSARPMSFLGASAFQWVNAKAWMMVVSMLAVYAPVGFGVAGGIAIVVAVNLIMAVLSSVTWTTFGMVLASWLSSPMRLRLFNIAMATLLVATLIPPALDMIAKLT